MNRGTRPHPAKTAAIPGLAAEHWWIAEVCTAPGGLCLFGLHPLADEPDITRVVKVGGPDSFNQLFARPLPERYALWQGRFSLQSVRCKEKAEFVVVRSSVALSHWPAMQWYSPLAEEPDITLDVKVGGARQL